jgi:hypothetical protein
MHSPTSFMSPELSFANFDLTSFGQVPVPSHPLRFGFQVDIVPSQAPSPHLLFGLAGHVKEASGHSRSVGFAVRIDLSSGEIWDMLNDTGLIGWLECRDRMDQFTDEEPMLLSWEVEHLGSALIPRLQIAGEEWLYPAVPRYESLVLDTMAGCIAPKGAAAHLYLHPALWRESL